MPRGIPGSGPYAGRNRRCGKADALPETPLKKSKAAAKATKAGKTAGKSPRGRSKAATAGSR